MKLIFEKSIPGRGQDIFPACDVPCKLPDAPLREKKAHLPEISENEMGRHYTALAKRAHGVNDGFYPLGSCTMKHNPRINEKMASLPGFTKLHPLQPAHTVEGANELIADLERFLCEITGMAGVTFQPAAGAHGEFTGLLLIKAYHHDRGDFERNEIIVPDAAHGTNPASATMAGYKTIVIKSNENGTVDIDDLKAHLGPKTAGLMLTNPNTVGLFDPNIMEITRLVHEAGGLCYYDGANLNAVIGIVRPADIGFDVIHMNLHKTFSTPHGGGGPGSGPCAYKDFLAPFAPGLVCKDGEYTRAEKSIGNMTGFYGNFLVVVKALTYILSLGREGIPEAAENAVLNANYLMERMRGTFEPAFDRICMHEFVLSLEEYKKATGVTALDVAKSLIDHGVHPPTMYFPLIVHEALMLEPTETESKATLDEAAEIFRALYKQGFEDPETMKTAPHKAKIGRPDEVRAARNPVLRWKQEE